MKRTLLLGSAWTASAAAAVGLGFLAISFVDASASTPSQDLESSVTTVQAGEGASSTASAATGSPSTASAATGSASTGSPSTGSASTGSAAPVAAGQQVTDGGTVYGSCDGAVPVLASAPAAGWWLDDSRDAGEVEFEDGSRKIEVRVTCLDGVPQFSVEGPRADGSGGGNSGRSGGSDDSGTAPAPAATTASPVDDSDGRHGGGHGSDDDGASSAPSGPDGSGDDSDGRRGGGHGSDD